MNEQEFLISEGPWTVPVLGQLLQWNEMAFLYEMMYNCIDQGPDSPQDGLSPSCLCQVLAIKGKPINWKIVLTQR